MEWTPFPTPRDSSPAERSLILRSAGLITSNFVRGQNVVNFGKPGDLI
jgi:hypothetical protein